jgi:hypothetical protein
LRPAPPQRMKGRSFRLRTTDHRRVEGGTVGGLLSLRGARRGYRCWAIRPEHVCYGSDGCRLSVVRSPPRRCPRRAGATNGRSGSVPATERRESAWPGGSLRRLPCHPPHPGPHRAGYKAGPFSVSAVSAPDASTPRAPPSASRVAPTALAWSPWRPSPCGTAPGHGNTAHTPMPRPP